MVTHTLAQPRRSSAPPASHTEAILDLAVDLCHPTRILFVGCGSGVEAGKFSRVFDAQAIGIDFGPDSSFDREHSAPAVLLDMAPNDLQFPDGHFDLVCSFRSLGGTGGGTMPVLREMARVLSRGGHFLIAAPRRHRLFGWTAAMPARTGGVAHTEAELLALAHSAFGEARPLAAAYYRRLYGPALAAWFERTGLDRLAYSRVLVGGRKA